MRGGQKVGGYEEEGGALKEGCRERGQWWFAWLWQSTPPQGGAGCLYSVVVTLTGLLPSCGLSTCLLPVC
jgi:hypothetical protein